MSCILAFSLYFWFAPSVLIQAAVTSGMNFVVVRAGPQVNKQPSRFRSDTEGVENKGSYQGGAPLPSSRSAFFFCSVRTVGIDEEGMTRGEKRPRWRVGGGRSGCASSCLRDLCFCVCDRLTLNPPTPAVAGSIPRPIQAVGLPSSVHGVAALQLPDLLSWGGPRQGGVWRGLGKKRRKKPSRRFLVQDGIRTG